MILGSALGWRYSRLRLLLLFATQLPFRSFSAVLTKPPQCASATACFNRTVVKLYPTARVTSVDETSHMITLRIQLEARWSDTRLSRASSTSVSGVWTPSLYYPESQKTIEEPESISQDYATSADHEVVLQRIDHIRVHARHWDEPFGTARTSVVLSSRSQLVSLELPGGSATAVHEVAGMDEATVKVSLHNKEVLISAEASFPVWAAFATQGLPALLPALLAYSTLFLEAGHGDTRLMVSAVALLAALGHTLLLTPGDRAQYRRFWVAAWISAAWVLWIAVAHVVDMSWELRGHSCMGVWLPMQRRLLPFLWLGSLAGALAVPATTWGAFILVVLLSLGAVCGCVLAMHRLDAASGKGAIPPLAPLAAGMPVVVDQRLQALEGMCAHLDTRTADLRAQLEECLEESRLSDHDSGAGSEDEICSPLIGTTVAQGISPWEQDWSRYSVPKSADHTREGPAPHIQEEAGGPSSECIIAVSGGHTSVQPKAAVTPVMSTKQPPPILSGAKAGITEPSLKEPKDKLHSPVLGSGGDKSAAMLKKEISELRQRKGKVAAGSDEAKRLDDMIKQLKKKAAQTSLKVIDQTSTPNTPLEYPPPTVRDADNEFASSLAKSLESHQSKLRQHGEARRRSSPSLTRPQQPQASKIPLVGGSKPGKKNKLGDVFAVE